MEDEENTYAGECVFLYPFCIACGQNIEIVWGESRFTVGTCGCAKGRPISLAQWEVLERFSVGVKMMVLNARYPYSELSARSRGDVEREVALQVGEGSRAQVLRRLRDGVN